MAQIRVNGIKYIPKIHRLVLRAFVGEPPVGMEAAHLDGNRKNAHLDNLRWVTKKENWSHRHAHGTCLCGKGLLLPDGTQRKALQGEKNPKAKLTEEDIRAIRAAILSGELQYLVAARYGLSRNLVYKICARKVWKHVT